MLSMDRLLHVTFRGYLMPRSINQKFSHTKSVKLAPPAIQLNDVLACSGVEHPADPLSLRAAPQKEAVHPSVPVVVFGGTAILSGASVLLLPETAGRPLPQVLADVMKGRRHRQTG